MRFLPIQQRRVVLLILLLPFSSILSFYNSILKGIRSERSSLGLDLRKPHHQIEVTRSKLKEMTDTAQVISAKTLVWKTSASSNVQYFLLVLNLQDYVNPNQVENYVKERIRLASKEKAEILTKQKIGSILPFLPSSMEKLPDFRVLIDEKLVEHPDCMIRFIHTTQKSTKSGASSSLADDTGGKMIIEISSLELMRLTDGEIVSLSSNYPIRSDFPERQPIERSMKLTHKNDSDDSIIYFSPSQLRKIAMTSDYAKMVQVLSALRHRQFHSSYNFPDYFTMSDHVNVASRSGGKTAIQLACWKGSLPIIQLLLQFGANLNQYSTNEHNYGKTAIFYAITQCRDDVVLYLLKDHSPNLLIVNNKGQTPLSLAITHLSEETIRIVEEKEKLLEESKRYEWMNFYDSEHRGRGVFGDLDPRFISRSHYREIVDTLLTIRSKRDEKDLLQPNEAEDGDRLSSLAISRILMSTEDDTRSFFLETDELEARCEETKYARIVPIFPTTLETRRNIRSVYMIQQLQGQLESNTSQLIADQQSTSSAPGRSKSQKFLRHKALEEEKLILQEFSGDVLPSAHHDSNIIDIHHKGHTTLKGIITAKRQLSNKLVFLNISPNQSLLNSSTPHFTASQLRYSWRTADAGLAETKNYYAIQLIVGKTFRSNLEDLYQQKETTSSTINAGNGTVMMEKVCKIMKVGHVIEIDGEIKSVQERTNPILPSTGLYSSKTLGGEVEEKEEKYFEVEMIVHRLSFIGAEIVPTLPDLIDKVPDLGNSSPTANISLITSKNEAKHKKMKSEKIESGSPLVKTQTVETEYVNLKDLTFFVDHLANPSLEKYINTKDPVYVLDWNHSNDIQHFISVMRTTFDYLQHSPSSVDSSMSLSIDPRQLIGIDCEWKPEHYDSLNSKNADTENSLKGKSGIQQLEQNLDKTSTINKKENRNAFLRINPVEIMQISTIYGVFLFDMRRLFLATDEYHTNHDEEVKEDLRKVLLSLFDHQRLYKIGFELHQDLERLFSSYHSLFFPSESSNERSLNFHIQSIIDINSLTKVMVSSLRGFHKQHRWSGLSKSDYTSLSKLTKLLFNFEKTLNKEQQCSAWHERPLSEAQIEYAALDAAILIELFQRLTAEILQVHSHHTVYGFLKVSSCEFPFTSLITIC